jgi:hypothetical protein
VASRSSLPSIAFHELSPAIMNRDRRRLPGWSDHGRAIGRCEPFDDRCDQYPRPDISRTA